MRLIKLIKGAATALLVLAIALVLISFLIPDIIPSKPVNSRESYSQMLAYVALLESYSLQNKIPLSCDGSREAGRNLQDQWHRDLRCSVEGGSLFIRSAGADGTFDSKDDLIVRRIIK